jgi:hypothetical protein
LKEKSKVQAKVGREWKQEEPSALKGNNSIFPLSGMRTSKISLRDEGGDGGEIMLTVCLSETS